MTDALKDVLPRVKAAWQDGQAEALYKMPELGQTFHFAPRFPLVNVQLPPKNLGEALPLGLTPESFGPAFDSILEAQRSGDFSRIAPPEGVTEHELREAWHAVSLFADSGALAYRKVRFSIELAKAHIEACGVDDLFLVVDEDHKVVAGLDYFWALSEMEEHQAAPVVILSNAPFNAGYRHLLEQEEEEQRTFRKSDALQEVLRDASPEERETLLSFGFAYKPEVVTLTASTATLDLLGELITKQLGESKPARKATVKYDPAQLLYIESLRVMILKVRQKLVAEGKLAGDVVEKLERHLQDEREMHARGSDMQARRNWRWEEASDGLYYHPAMPRYRFRLVDRAPQPMAPVLAESRVQPHDAAPMQRVITGDQFRLMAKTHFGLDATDARELYTTTPIEEFDARYWRYIDLAPEVAPDAPGQPDAEELAARDERLELWNAVL